MCVLLRVFILDKLVYSVLKIRTTLPDTGMHRNSRVSIYLGDHPEIMSYEFGNFLYFLFLIASSVSANSLVYFTL